MTEWEYRKIMLSEAPRRGDDIDLLNNAGKDGWELVSISNNNVAYLKRRHPEAPPPPPPPPPPTVTRRRSTSRSSEA